MEYPPVLIGNSLSPLKLFVILVLVIFDSYGIRSKCPKWINVKVGHQPIPYVKLRIN